MKQQLESLSREFYKNSKKVINARIEDILNAGKRLFAPEDLTHFNKVLFASCKKYQVEQRSFGYSETRNRLHQLRSKFGDRYDFLVAGAVMMNREEAIPVVNFKQGGVLNTWMLLTPEGSRSVFLAILINEKFSTLEKFFDRYFKEVDKNYELAQNAIIYKHRTNIVQQARKHNYGQSNVINYYQTGKQRDYRNNSRSYNNNL